MSAERTRTIYLQPTGSGADAYAQFAVATLYKTGELGGIVPDVGNSRRWQLVKLDSGVTSAIAGGVVAAGDVAFWKDKNNYLVTKDPAQANAVNAPAGGWGNAGNATLDARNFVAGVFTNASVTAAVPYTLILQRTDQAAGYSVKASSATYNAGDLAVAATGTGSDIVNVAAGTAPTCVVLGTVLGARVSGKVPVWLNLPETD